MLEEISSLCLRATFFVTSASSSRVHTGPGVGHCWHLWPLAPWAEAWATWGRLVGQTLLVCHPQSVPFTKCLQLEGQGIVVGFESGDMGTRTLAVGGISRITVGFRLEGHVDAAGRPHLGSSAMPTVK